MTNEQRQTDWYLKQGGLSGIHSGVALHLKNSTHIFTTMLHLTLIVVIEKAQTLTTASTAGDVSPTTRRAGHLRDTQTDWITERFKWHQTTDKGKQQEYLSVVTVFSFRPTIGRSICNSVRLTDKTDTWAKNRPQSVSYWNSCKHIFNPDIYCNNNAPGQCKRYLVLTDVILLRMFYGQICAFNLHQLRTSQTIVSYLS